MRDLMTPEQIAAYRVKYDQIPNSVDYIGTFDMFLQLCYSPMMCDGAIARDMSDTLGDYHLIVEVNGHAHS